jgi:hypothetical protein
MSPNSKRKTKPARKPYVSKTWSFNREVLLLVVFVDPRDTRKIPGVALVYATDIKSGIKTLRKAEAIPPGCLILLARDFSEADADDSGVVLSIKPATPEALLDRAEKTKKGSFAELFKECEIYNKTDLAVLLVELDILLNPERYPGILPYKPDTQTLIDSYAASRDMLESLNKERREVMRSSYLHIKKEELGIFEPPSPPEEPKRADPLPKKIVIPPLREFVEAYGNGVESLCQLIEELRDDVMMSDIVLRLYEVGLSNNEVKNFYKYYYTIWKGGRL